MTMLDSEPWVSTLVTRTLVSLKSWFLMRSLIACYRQLRFGSAILRLPYLLSNANADLLLLDT
jgi:hypothetical protein